MADAIDVAAPASSFRVVVAALTAAGSLAPQSLERFVELIEQFGRYADHSSGVVDLRAVTPAMVAAFIDSSCSDGPATLSVRHFRRAAVRMLFRVARELGLADGDPTLDLVLPAREPGVFRALTDDEVALCRLSSVASLEETRLPAAWALAEATARTSELSEITGADIDLDRNQVWLGGASKVDARWGQLSPWGRIQLERRLAALGDPSRPVTYDGAGSAQSRQAAACISISSTLARAGLGDEPALRPLSVTAWAGQQILAESGRIDVVARRLGMRSLDRTAKLIGLQWQPTAVGDCDG